MNNSVPIPPEIEDATCRRYYIYFHQWVRWQETPWWRRWRLFAPYGVHIVNQLIKDWARDDVKRAIAIIKEEFLSERTAQQDAQ